MTPVREIVSSEERKYCRYLKVDRMLIEQTNAKPIVQTWVVLENTRMLLWTLARTEKVFVIDCM